ncbi:hypothetical protein FQZ97_1164790 [compost metagenome]
MYAMLTTRHTVTAIEQNATIHARRSLRLTMVITFDSKSIDFLRISCEASDNSRLKNAISALKTLLIRHRHVWLDTTLKASWSPASTCWPTPEPAASAPHNCGEPY